MSGNVPYVAGPCFRYTQDAVVVLAHMDYRDDLVDLLWRTLRSRVGETKPIQVFAGHSHIRGYRWGCHGTYPLVNLTELWKITIVYGKIRYNW